MASFEHLTLSDFIKSVHRKLREESQVSGVEQAWQKHCADEENLTKYAVAMKELATNHWEQNHDTHAEVSSRILWSCNTCLVYFTNDIVKYQKKEYEIGVKIDSKVPTIKLNTVRNINNKLQLLDVGSCYNPFRKFEYFEVTAIDIAPALDEVLKGDFLSLTIGDSVVIKNKEVFEVPESYFDVVIFSLLLEYLPSPKQRLICCEKAYSLLKTEGILIIITPDSNHVGTNAKYIKSWRFILAEMGFSRIKYEKLSHIHCMAFRKAFCKNITKRWAELHKREKVFEEMFIPQDFNKLKLDEMVTKTDHSKDKCLDEDFLQTFNELPGCDIFQ